MAEQPVGAHREGAGSAPLREEHPVQPEYPLFPTPYLWRPPPPRVVVKADLLPAISIMTTVALFGLAVGWLWAQLAPPQRMIVTRDGTPAPLTAESYHRFDALVIFTLLCLGAGVLTGVAVWFLRERRGPVAMFATVIGGGLGGWLASTMGGTFADGRWPAPTKVEVLDIVSKAPELESGWGWLAWPLATALAYGLLALLNGMDDLGRRLG